MIEDINEYKKVMLEIVDRQGAIPSVWSSHLYQLFKDSFIEDEDGYKTFQGKRIYFINEKDGTLIDWRKLENEI